MHRLIHGGWRAGPGRVWAGARGLDVDAVPVAAVTPDLFSETDETDPDEPIRSDGHLDAAWVEGTWSGTEDRARRWVELAADVADLQAAELTSPRRLTTARSESAAEMLCAELAADGLPIDVDEAERIIGNIVGPRPADAAAAAAQLAERDRLVLDHVPAGLPRDIDLRSPGQVKTLLRTVGIEVEDTRAWRLEPLRDRHPIVDALLRWRKQERMSTTFGYAWIDEHVTTSTLGRRGRLRGRWSGSDGAAGRMTATAGLHNMPAELRPAIRADPGWALVHADLGQIEPRVLAAVSGDGALARASDDTDMYLPVARRLGVERDIAKVAVLGAMYGQTTGIGAEALRGLERAYPVAMGFLHDADEAAQGGNDLVTIGGRRIRVGAEVTLDTSDRDARARAAARGRYGRNALVQGAAAEFFKTWAVLVRARLAPDDGQIVLCLHDELLVHTPADRSPRVRDIVDGCLQETAGRWSPPSDPAVRFVADVSVVERWSDAK